LTSLSLYIFTIWKCIVYNFFCRDGIYFDKIFTASSASFLDLYLEFDDSGQLSTNIYDKRDDFNFKIINFPNMCSNIPKINRLEEGHNSYPLVCWRPAETVSLQRRQICYRWGTPAYWSLVPRSSMFYLLRSFSRVSSIKTFDFSTLYTTLPHDKLKTCLKETIHKVFSHRNDGSTIFALGYNSTYFSNKIRKGKTCESLSGE
jgi:hypothetical protein